MPSRSPLIGLMVAKDALDVIKSTLSEEDLTRFREEYGIPDLMRLKLLGPSDRVTMGLITHVALYEEVFKVRPRLSLLSVVVELLRWYQICPTQMVPSV